MNNTIYLESLQFLKIIFDKNEIPNNPIDFLNQITYLKCNQNNFNLICQAKTKSGKRCSKKRKFGIWCGTHKSKQPYGCFKNSEYTNFYIENCDISNNLLDLTCENDKNEYKINIKNRQVIKLV